jgi:hypothetical protein
MSSESRGRRSEEEERERWWQVGECLLDPSAPAVFEAVEGNPYATAVAKSICAACPVWVRALCLAEEMEAEHGQPAEFRWGIYGGLDPRERTELDRKDGCIVCGGPLCEDGSRAMRCPEHQLGRHRQQRGRKP